MASKKEIAEELRREYGNTLSQNEVRLFLRKGKSETVAFLEGVPFMQEGRKKTYLSIDVARKIYETMQTAV